ncbi:spore germination lipoprotein GerD [Bacillus kwashiorkori]|uniref:spore germination lipoprotein GerD n=1 Tax=Bacillus kwashiorkori TaxID=1522318 RepID=UPI000780406F|nr:spore germination lipoprotein GerD [Bacillus kwashiorkori]
MKKALFLLLVIIITTTGCSTEDIGQGNMDYDQTKKMVVDIIKTEDGKKALKEVLADDELKHQLVLDNEVVTNSIEKTLVSDKGKDFWQNSFKDPKFAETYAKSLKKENETLMKDLMKDPEYRAMLLEILHDPELEKEYADLLKSKEYRAHLQEVITETIESPLFQARIQEILLKAAQEQQKKEEKK